MADQLQSSRVRIKDSLRAIQDYLWEQGWTDGLPVVAPTEPLVREMLSGYGGEPSDSLGRIQPGNSNVTLEKLAVNAVMAGCLPEHFPVVVAAVKAAL
ncbi:MAG: thiol reductase thioredoxin, partial [Chloroflexi bacterium]|nr:thiol reductase thioredoxin [Chloroflexota bacterium]